MSTLSIDHFKGCLVGLALGDAIGTTLEFEITGEFEPITDLVGGGPFMLKPGEWTDDTSMALCLAESLVKDGFDLESQIKHYLEWFKNGRWSVKGFCFDIGGTTKKSLGHYQRHHEIYDNSKDVYALGNGALMRVGSIPLYYANSFEEAIEKAEEASSTTHNHPVCRKCCGYLSGIIWNAIHGKSKEELLNGLESHFDSISDDPYYPLLQGIQNKSYLKKKSESFSTQFVNTGFVISCLEAALWGFFTSDNYKEGVLKLANLGGDSDTVCTVFGQLAGAYYGYTSLPQEWVSKVAMLDEILNFANIFYNRHISK